MVQRHALDGAALAYIRDALNIGHALSRFALQLPLEQGEVFTYASERRHHALTDFYFGGIAPGEEPEVGKLVGGLVADFLNAGADHLALIEDFLDPLSAPHLATETRSIWYDQEEVYYPLFPGMHSIADISKTLRLVSSGFVLVAVLSTSTTLRPAHRAAIRPEDLEEVARNAHYLIIGAYDDEGYLIWRRYPERP